MYICIALPIGGIAGTGGSSSHCPPHHQAPPTSSSTTKSSEATIVPTTTPKEGGGEPEGGDPYGGSTDEEEMETEIVTTGKVLVCVLELGLQVVRSLILICSQKSPFSTYI